MKRTAVIETVKKSGEVVTLAGWVHARRDMGKIIFIDLRDRSGIVQVVFAPGNPGYDRAKELRPEWVVRIDGLVKDRNPKQFNEKIPTGKVEVEARELVVLNQSKTPPFPLDGDTREIGEDVRLKYRYLDLRTPRLQKNMQLRSDYIQKAREFLFNNGFTEIETPILTKATPEGSRDFIVPSRLQPGKFFALPQSPQQYKQMLMIAGFERYFQIARALRDEDLRADRGFEHTQIDVEMSFVEREDVMQIIEKMVIFMAESLGFAVKEKPFPRFSYAEAMKRFGADKFDLRTEDDKKNGVLAYAWVVDFPFFEKTDEGGWTFTHNPFSNPLPEFRDDHLKGKNTEEVLTAQYDLVCNGYEVAGGSIRAHEPEVLEATYRTMGYTDAEIQDSVGHMLEALRFGAPPHGGIAFGVERNIMNLAGESYLREVQAFPTTASGRTAVTDAPTTLGAKQLKEAHIKCIV